MDHYKVLGVSKNASKEEIKQAYRKLAMQYHPDKHALSPKHLKDAATLKFKQLSQAYDTLIDDRKHADYNITRRSNASYYNNHSNYSNYNNYSRQGSNYNYGYGYSGRGAPADGGVKPGGFALRMEVLFRFLTSRSFLLNAAFASALLGASVIIDSGGKTLWKMQNSGKSFEEAMESIEKAKTLKDKMSRASGKSSSW